MESNHGNIYFHKDLILFGFQYFNSDRGRFLYRINTIKPAKRESAILDS